MSTRMVDRPEDHPVTRPALNEPGALEIAEPDGGSAPRCAGAVGDLAELELVGVAQGADDLGGVVAQAGGAGRRRAGTASG